MEKERLNNVEGIPAEEVSQQKEIIISGVVSARKEKSKKGYESFKTAKQIWFQLVFEAKREFPEDVQAIITKIANRKNVSGLEQSHFNLALNAWWKERFGFSFEAKQNRYEIAKQERMRRLHAALRQLDAGEPIGEFEYATRRKIFYDKDKNMLATSDGGGEHPLTFLTVGDLLSDYAWDIRYAPDFEKMSDNRSMARQIAKRILLNEARRDIEAIYDSELASQYEGASGVQKIHTLLSGQKLVQEKTGHEGVIAEIMAREALSRIATDNDFGFTVLRANAIEDGLYKYDFKIHAKERKRGVEIEDEKNFEKRLSNIGIQFTITKYSASEKKSQIIKAKEAYGKEILVDDIVLIQIRSHEFQAAFNMWLRLGKPSGGPEQFLPPELKIDLLRQATQGLVKIKEETLLQAARVFLRTKQ